MLNACAEKAMFVHYKNFKRMFEHLCQRQIKFIILHLKRAYTINNVS